MSELEKLDLTTRAINQLKIANIFTKQDVLNLTTNDMILLKFGRKTIQEISDFKRKYITSSNPEDIISNLNRYECTSNSGGQDCWATMEKSLNGEYVLFDDVIKAVSILFSREKE